MQLNLTFLEVPNPSASLWQALDEEQRVVVLEVLARLIAQAAQPQPDAEESDDDR